MNLLTEYDIEQLKMYEVDVYQSQKYINQCYYGIIPIGLLSFNLLLDYSFYIVCGYCCYYICLIMLKSERIDKLNETYSKIIEKYNKN